jgi:chromosome partitioning protein
VSKGPVCVAVINLKGGVGKTTIAALLGRHAVGTLGLKVLAVDLDPQANLSQAYMHTTYRRFLNSSRPSIVEVFSGMHPPAPGKPSPTPLKIRDAIVRIYRARKGDGHLDLIPSRFDFSNYLTDSLKPEPRVLAECIARHFQDKDLVLIDCAPTESVFTTAAYHASRFVLVPVRPEFFATIGFPLLQESLDSFRQGNRGHTIDVAGVVINNAFYDGGNDGGPEKQQALREIKDEARKNGWKLFDNEILHSRGFPKRMRGDYRWSGNARFFPVFAMEFFRRLGLPAAKR